VIPNYLGSLKFEQDHTKANIRLALGYAAVIISGATFYYDWTMGWDKTKYWTAWAVLAYFLLNGAFTYWIWVVEKGIVFEGSRSDGGKVRYAPALFFAGKLPLSPIFISMKAHGTNYILGRLS